MQNFIANSLPEMPSKNSGTISIGFFDLPTPQQDAGKIIPQPQLPFTLDCLRSCVPALPIFPIASLTPEMVNRFYQYSLSQIDYAGEIKHDLLLHIADFLLTVIADIPKERCQVYPPEFNLAYIQPQNEEEMHAFHRFPFLYLAMKYDVGHSTGEQVTLAMLKYASHLLEGKKIDTDNPFVIDVKSLIPPESSYRLGLYTRRPFPGGNVICPMKNIFCPLEPYFCSQTYRDRVMMYWPLQSLVKQDDSYIRPFALPHQKYSLWGFDKVLSTAATTLVLTPDLNEYYLNNNQIDMAIVSWFGAQYTLSKVDFTPLQGRRVIYVFNPGSFNGDRQACRACMDDVTVRLNALGCSVTIMANPAYEVTQLMPCPPMDVATPVLSPFYSTVQPLMK